MTSDPPSDPSPAAASAPVPFPGRGVHGVGVAMLALFGWGMAHPEAMLTLRTTADLGWDPSAVWGMLMVAGTGMALGVGLLGVPVRPGGADPSRGCPPEVYFRIVPAVMFLGAHALVPFKNPDRALGFVETFSRVSPLLVLLVVLVLSAPMRHLQRQVRAPEDTPVTGAFLLRAIAALHTLAFAILGATMVGVPLGVMAFVYGVHVLWDPELITILRPHGLTLVGFAFLWLLALRRPRAGRGLLLVGSLMDLGHAVAYLYASGHAPDGTRLAHLAAASGIGLMAVLGLFAATRVRDIVPDRTDRDPAAPPPGDQPPGQG